MGLRMIESGLTKIKQNGIIFYIHNQESVKCISSESHSSFVVNRILNCLENSAPVRDGDYCENRQAGCKQRKTRLCLLVTLLRCTLMPNLFSPGGWWEGYPVWSYSAGVQQRDIARIWQRSLSTLRQPDLLHNNNATNLAQNMRKQTVSRRDSFSLHSATLT